MKSFPGTCFSFSIPAIFLISMAVELSSHLVRNMHCRTGYNLYYSLHASDEHEVFLCSMGSGLLELGCLDIHAQEVFQQGHGNCSWSMKNMENFFFTFIEIEWSVRSFDPRLPSYFVDGIRSERSIPKWYSEHDRKIGWSEEVPICPPEHANVSTNFVPEP